jgi:arsenate reductase
MPNTPNQKTIFAPLNKTLESLLAQFDTITGERKVILKELTDFIRQKSEAGQPIHLNFICTHNSRRSHIAQIWAQLAAYFYGVNDVTCFSGGTEATAFNRRAVQAMETAGFKITINQDGANPVYDVRYASNAPTLTVFSKKYDDEFNPKKDFAAIMTCSHADENCPLVLGAVKRITLTYNDPKDFDGTPLESAKYSERVHEIGKEILYALSRVK